jgi:hypothetical protein
MECGGLPALSGDGTRSVVVARQASPKKKREQAPALHTQQMSFSSVGARHAVPEHASITVAPYSETKERILSFPRFANAKPQSTCGTGRNACATKIAATSYGTIAPSFIAGHGMPCPY